LPRPIVRHCRAKPAPLVRSGDGSWRSGRPDTVRRGDFDVLAATHKPSWPPR
jgi:hypothetical protein